MTTLAAPIRSLFYLATAAGSLAVLAPAPVEETAVLNHWVLETEGLENVGELYQQARELAAHMNEAHPEVHLEVFRNSGLEPDRRVHLVLETASSTALRQFITESPKDEECRSLLETVEVAPVGRDSYLRLISTDPGNPNRLERGPRLVVWSLGTHFPRVGEAIECAQKLARHVNASYPGLTVRAYDEWFPHTGRIHFYFYVARPPGWEIQEARMRRDPVIRELFEGAAGAFVEGDFEDLWLNDLTR
jgi:hypothetical protein